MADRGNPNWKRGQSANPGGRPRALREVTDLARALSEAAIAALAKIMEDETAPKAARVSAAVAILDRAFGKPAQTVETITNRSMSDLSDAELAEIAAGDDDTALH